MPFVLVLLLYTRAWDAAPKFAFPWDASQWFTALKPAPVHTTQPSRLTFSRSWYIESSVASKIADMQALGQQDVHWMVSGHQCSGSNYGSFVILDFGEPHTSNGTYGTYTVKTDLFWSDADIADAAKQYMTAWHTVASACRLKLAIGLSNHHECAYNGPSCSITKVGTLWADMVNSLNTWIQSRSYDKQFQVWGAYDAETTWDGADKTRQFVDGFNGNDTFKLPLVDFGDMRQGAPLIDPDTGQAEQTWTDEDRYYVAWKAPYDIALPEIYDTPDLQDWVRLQRQESYQDLSFFGTMTEACSPGGILPITDPRVDCGTIFNGYGFTPSTALSQLKQNMLQHDRLYYVTSMPVPYPYTRPVPRLMTIGSNDNKYGETVLFRQCCSSRRRSRPVTISTTGVVALML